MNAPIAIKRKAKYACWTVRTRTKKQTSYDFKLLIPAVNTKSYLRRVSKIDLDLNFSKRASDRNQSCQQTYRYFLQSPDIGEAWAAYCRPPLFIWFFSLIAVCRLFGISISNLVTFIKIPRCILHADGRKSVRQKQWSRPKPKLPGFVSHFLALDKTEVASLRYYGLPGTMITLNVLV